MTPRPVLLGGYAAKSCARVTHNRYDATVPEQPSVVPAHLQRLFDLGNDHEAAVFDGWCRADAAVLDLRPFDGDKPAHITATVAAMDGGVPVILGGRLPDDQAGGRTGKPDVLLAEVNGTGYHPADVKAHLVLDRKKSGGLTSDTAAPALADAAAGDLGLRYREADLIQLAHYWRMLQACGHQAAAPWGAIIGTDPGPQPVLAWYDLTEPLFTTFSRSQGKTSRSSLERYDHEHDFRVRVARVAQQRAGTSADPEPLVAPVGQEECLVCAWAPVCIDLLPPDELSFELRGTLSVREYLALRQAGVHTTGDLIAADPVALLASPYVDETSHVTQRAKRLYKAHMSAQLARDGVVLRLKPGADFDVPRARVEIDLDMECTRDGRVYLWGALVTADGTSTFQTFLDLTVDDDAAERALARRCFDWLARHHPTARVYHYAPVEKTHAVRILGSDAYLGTTADPATWIDLLPPVRACLDSRDGHGLKVVATEGAGFHWRDEDPGGFQSQDWLDQARAGDQAATQRILDYNEDDVRATLAVRDWLGLSLAGRAAARRGK